MKASKSQRLLYYAFGTTPVGKILVAATERGVCTLRLQEGTTRESMLAALSRDFPDADRRLDGRRLGPVLEQINRILKGEISAAALRLDMAGTALQKRVWQELQCVPRGTTCSYSDLARRVGRPRAVRAVAHACACNPVALIVPCHRILRRDGSLGGYYYGLEKKLQILRLENVDI